MAFLPRFPPGAAFDGGRGLDDQALFGKSAQSLVDDAFHLGVQVDGEPDPFAVLLFQDASRTGGVVESVWGVGSIRSLRMRTSTSVYQVVPFALIMGSQT